MNKSDSNNAYFDKTKDNSKQPARPYYEFFSGKEVFPVKVFTMSSKKSQKQ